MEELRVRVSVGDRVRSCLKNKQKPSGGSGCSKHTKHLLIECKHFRVALSELYHSFHLMEKKKSKEDASWLLPATWVSHDKTGVVSEIT